jgi:hypothetical protein
LVSVLDPIDAEHVQGRFSRPVFILAPPRSGTTLLFRLLAQAPDVWTIGRESNEVIEGIDRLCPPYRQWESNRLTAEDADGQTIRLLTERFFGELRDRNGNQPKPHESGLRMIEKTPRNCLRVPFLAAAFPDAFFIYLFRNPVETVSSMLDAWKSGRFISHPRLPGWEGSWSLLLVPGWRELHGKDLAEIAARQWAIATSCLLDDLASIPQERRRVVSFDHLIAEPQREIERLCAAVDIRWDRKLTAPLPASGSELTPPEPSKWKHNGKDLARVMPLIRVEAERAMSTAALQTEGWARTLLPRTQYQHRDWNVIDYHEYPLLKSFSARGPAPPSLDPKRYFACVGAAQTFGCFCEEPYPALLQRRLPLPALNLGQAGAGPRFFANQPLLLDLINRSRFAIVQVMSGRSEDNALFDSGGLGMVRRRSDGALRSAMGAWRELISDHEQQYVERIVAETRQNWIDSFRALLSLIEPPKILFWFSVRSPEYTERFGSAEGLFGAFPQLVNQALLDEIRTACDHYVECVSDNGLPQPLFNRFDGEQTTIDYTLRNDRPMVLSYNNYYPSPEMHRDAADALEAICRTFV